MITRFCFQSFLTFKLFSALELSDMSAAAVMASSLVMHVEFMDVAPKVVCGELLFSLDMLVMSICVFISVVFIQFLVLSFQLSFISSCC